MTLLNIFRIDNLNKEISHLIQTLPTVNTRGRQTKRNLEFCQESERVSTGSGCCLKRTQTSERSFHRSFHRGVLSLQGLPFFNNLRPQMTTYFAYLLICLGRMYCEYQCQ